MLHHRHDYATLADDHNDHHCLLWDAGGALSYTLSDGLGSVSEAINTSSGAVSATQIYGPYGGVRYASGILPTDYGFTYQRADAVSRLSRSTHDRPSTTPTCRDISSHSPTPLTG